MGMQCHFKKSELDGTDIFFTVAQDLESINIPRTSHDITVNYDAKSGDCWFDVGFTTELQMDWIKFLIRNRICFSCS